MKKVLFLAALIAGFMATAQHQNRDRAPKNDMAKMTPEQIATLRTKKLALVLDLSESQQKEVQRLNLENAAYFKEKLAERKAQKESGTMKKPSPDERFAIRNEMLDRALAQQTAMKKILDKEQFEQWRKMRAKEIGHRKKKEKKLSATK